MNTRRHSATTISMLLITAVNISCSIGTPSIAKIEKMNAEILICQSKYIQKAESIQISDRLKNNLRTGRTVCYFNQESLEHDKKWYSNAVSIIKERIKTEPSPNKEASLSAEYIARVHSGFQYQQQPIASWMSEIEQSIINPGQGTEKVKSAIIGLDNSDIRQLLSLYSNLLNYLKDAEKITEKYNKNNFNPRSSPRT